MKQEGEPMNYLAMRSETDEMEEGSDGDGEGRPEELEEIREQESTSDNQE